MQKLPPYGKPLAALIDNGNRPNNDVHLFIGTHAWKKGKSFSASYPTRTLVLPAWQCPSLYEWPVQQCDILIVDTGYAETSYVEDIVHHLFLHNANIIRALWPDYSLTVYKKDF